MFKSTENEAKIDIIEKTLTAECFKGIKTNHCLKA